MQSRLASLIESIANVAIGFGIAIAAQMIVFPMFGMHVSAADNLAIGGIFTVISIARSYVMRRVFNRLGLRRRA